MGAKQTGFSRQLSALSWIDWLLLTVLFIGLSVGIFSWWRRLENKRREVDYLSNQTGAAPERSERVWVDVSGAVIAPGVYRLEGEARVKDALAAAGGLSAEADREYVARVLNLAGKLNDGQKIFVPAVSATGESAVGRSEQAVKGVATISLININSASMEELETLWGIGETRAADIIANRPYQEIGELLTKKLVPKNVFEKIKDKVSLY